MATYPMHDPDFEPIPSNRLVSIAGGRAAVFVTGDRFGQHDGWLCRPDGTPLERLAVANLAAAEARAQALVAKGKL